MAQEEYEPVPKLQVIPAATPASATFVISEEDHTLGNSLRYMLMRSPDTQFCGYSVPHPSEAVINVRLQTTGRPAADVLRQGLSELIQVANHIEGTFIRACNAAGAPLTEEDLAGSSPEAIAAAQAPAPAAAEDSEGKKRKGKGGK